jgi:hypothetical protein
MPAEDECIAVQNSHDFSTVIQMRQPICHIDNDVFCASGLVQSTCLMLHVSMEYIAVPCRNGFGKGMHMGSAESPLSR